MNNLQIKLMARGHNIPQWKIAEYLGISEITLSRMLRKELPLEKKEQIKKIIKELRVIFDKYKPDNIIVEEVLPEDVKHNQTVFKALMYLQAAVALEFNKDNKKLEFFVSSEWRKICGIRTGRGITRDTVKAADIKFVKDNYGLNVNDDIADAICIGYAYTHPIKTTRITEDGFEFK
jgi:Holliday junction resolvasome RuvABC endonuclease subunit